MPHGGVDDLLNAVNIGCKGSDDDAPLRLGKNFFKGFAKLLFGGRHARKLRICAVHQKRKNALCAVARKAVDVDRLVVNGRVVNLEVARVDNDADGGRDGKRDCARNGVADLDKFDFEAADLDNVAGIDALKAGVLNVMLMQLMVD